MTSHQASSVATLLRPFQCQSLTLRNRIVMAPMTRNMCPDYVPTDEVVAYYRRRAENNVGLIITEGTTVNQVAANGYEGVPAFHGEAALAGWKQVVDAVRKLLAVTGKKSSERTQLATLLFSLSRYLPLVISVEAGEAGAEAGAGAGAGASSSRSVAEAPPGRRQTAPAWSARPELGS